MASRLLGSFPRVSSITTGKSSWRNKKSANNYYAGCYVTAALRHKIGKLSKEHGNVMSLQHNNMKHQGIEGRSTCHKIERKYSMNAIFEQSHEYEPQAHDSKSISESIKDAMDVFRKFSRPYAFVGLALAIVSASLLTVEKLSDLSPAFFVGLVQYLAASFCMHIYHVGFNQIADVEIDKINKPYLPLASGQFSIRTAVIIVASFSLMSFALGLSAGSRPMLWSLFASFALGTAYSVNLPFLRWKRFPMLALLCIVACPLIGSNLGPFLHMKIHVLKRTTIYSRSLILTIMIMCLFHAVVALAKDIPDIEGDKALGIQTLAIHLGPKRVFWFCVSLLEMAYGVAILVGATSPILWSKIFTVLAHAIMALILWNQAKSIDQRSKASFQSFYMTIFKLIYVECILLPFVR